MKERRRAKYKSDEGLVIPQSMRPSRRDEFRLPVCNFYKLCTKSLTNACMYCIKNYSVWTEGEFALPKGGIHGRTGLSGQRYPRNLMDLFIEKPENVVQ